MYLLEATWDSFFSELAELITALGLDALVILGAIGVALVLQALARRMIHHAFAGTTVGEPTLFLNAVRWAIWFVAISTVADMVFDVQLDGVFAALGVGSLFISLGLQDLIKNVVSGVQIISGGVFKVGDQIVVGEHRGEVLDINWRQTVIRDIDGDPRAIPNSLFNTQVVVRRDDKMGYRHEMSVEVRPGLDLDEVAETFERVIGEALTERGLQQEGLSPQVRYLGATAYGTQASIRIFIDDIEHRTSAFDASMRAIAQTGYLSDCTKSYPYDREDGSAATT